MTTTKADEKRKYQEIWKHDNYREFSPGLRAGEMFNLPKFVRIFKARSVLDAGCGSGKLMRSLIEQLSPEVTIHGFDIAENCLDPWFDDIKDEVLHLGCLWEPGELPGAYDFVICTDVLEHIPTDRIPAVLANLFAATNRCCYLAVALFEDGYGPEILGQPLHLTVRPPDWWRQQIRSAGFAELKHAVETDADNQPIWLHFFAVKPGFEANLPA